MPAAPHPINGKKIINNIILFFFPISFSFLKLKPEIQLIASNDTFIYGFLYTI